MVIWNSHVDVMKELLLPLISYWNNVVKLAIILTNECLHWQTP